MKKLELDAFAKINLSLKVVNKREDNYHNIETIMQEIDLKDRLILEDRSQGLEITSSRNNIPLDRGNLVYQAWEKIQEKSGIRRGLKVHIEKNIPVGGGLAGGSTDAAAVLKGINQMWKLNYSLEELKEIGLEIGADLPFCLEGGTSLARGIGEKLSPFKKSREFHLILINPMVEVSTPQVYSSLKIRKNNYEIEKLRKKLEEGNLLELQGYLYNSLEEVVEKEIGEIEEIKEFILKNRGLASLMTGSGPTVFGIFENIEDRNYCLEEAKNYYPDYRIIASKTR